MQKEQEAYLRPTKLWNRSYIFLLFTSFFVAASFNMTMPVMSSAAESMGATGSLMGLAASVFAIVALATRPITNPMADLLNKKKQFQLAVCLYIVANLGYAISANVYMLIAFRCLQGFGLGIYGTIGTSLSSCYTPEEKISTGMGLYTLMQAASLAVGPYMSLWLINNLGYEACFYAAAVASVVGFILTLFFKDIDKKQSGRIAELFQKPKLDRFICFDCLIPVAIGCLFAIPFACMNSFVAQAAAENGVSSIGAFFTVYAVTTIVFRPVVEMLARKMGQRNTVILCGILFVAAMILSANATSLMMYMVVAALMGVGMGNGMIVLVIMSNQRVAPSRRGLASGTYFLGMDLGSGFGPIVGGAIAAAFGYNSLMYVLVVPLCIAIVIGFVGKKGMVPLTQSTMEEKEQAAS